MRNITSAMVTALCSGQLRPAFFVQGQFTSGTVYVWTGQGSITWGGHTWIGLGGLGSISTIEEAGSVAAKGITLTLSALDPAWLTHVLGEVQQGLPVLVFLGLFDTSNALIPDPVCSFSGRMDEPVITVAGETATLAINCESRLVDMDTPYNRRYTDEDQKIDYPNDRGFEFVSGIQEITLYWGRTPNSHNV